MTESQRLEMLNAMGVKALCPRFVLPGAKQSVRLEVEQQDSHLTTLDNESELLTKELAPETLLAESIKQKAPSTIIDEKGLGHSIFVDIKKDLDDKPSQKQIRIRYRVFQVGSLMMLVEQPNIEFDYNIEAKKFFSQIYFFLTGLKDFGFNESQFDWPPSKSFPQSSNRNDVLQACMGFLKGKAVQPFDWILVWGNQFQPIFSDEKPVLGDVVLAEDLNILQLPALSEFFKNPQQKSLLWQYLQAVKKSIV